MLKHVDNNGVIHDIKEIRHKKEIFPNGLELFEYLESTGTQRIDTGVIPDNNTQTDVKYQYTNTGNLNLFGTNNTSSKAYIVNIYNNKFEYNYYNSGWVSDINVTNGEIIDLNFNKNNKIYINGVAVKDLSTNAFTAAQSVYLFSRNGGAVSSRYKGKVYYFSMMKDNILIRYMIPCSYLEQIGMWDLIECKFYGNIGNDSFNVGPKLSIEEYEHLKENISNNKSYNKIHQIKKPGSNESYNIISINNLNNYYDDKYFTTVALKNGTITFTYITSVNTSLAQYLEYSFDNGQTWTRITNVDNTEVSKTINVTKGQKVIWRGINSTFSIGLGSSCHFSSTEIDISGNIMSLLYGNNFEQQTSLTNTYTFTELFNNCEIYNTKDLILPATTITEYCYYRMFYNCEHLTTSPKVLPALTALEESYSGMFYNCSILKTAPRLPATILDRRCYYQMFYNCSSLTTAPELLATSVATRSYEYMFYNCSSLVHVQSILPATSLGTYCYNSMFNGCTSLTTAPELPATNIANGAYGSMFQNCISLMTAPELQALTLKQNCYTNMFRGCSKLNYVKCLATSISASSCTSNWLDGVASTGTFIKNSSMSDWTTGVDGIPSGWTVQNA